MATKPNAVPVGRAIRERNESGATTMTLAEYKALSRRDLADLNAAEYGTIGGVQPGPLGSDWVEVEADDVG